MEYKDFGKEIKQLKRKINGYKGQVSVLQKEVSKLQHLIKGKDDIIEILRIKNYELENSKEELENMLADSKEYAASLEATIDTYQTSWWHRIFG